jgi:hypothetical protein
VIQDIRRVVGLYLAHAGVMLLRYYGNRNPAQQGAHD